LSPLNTGKLRERCVWLRGSVQDAGPRRQGRVVGRYGFAETDRMGGEGCGARVVWCGRLVVIDWLALCYVDDLPLFRYIFSKRLLQDE